MSETIQLGDRCANCPNRSRISRALARLAGSAESVEDCEGSVVVSRGEIFTQTRVGDEPAPDQKTWNSVIGSMDGGERRYSRTEWVKEEVCGMEVIEPQGDEIPYSAGDGTWVRDGQRHAAFIGGTDQQLSDHRGMLAIMAMLDG